MQVSSYLVPSPEAESTPATSLIVKNANNSHS